MNNPSPFYVAAKDYQERGWPCMPILRTQTKKPAVKWKKFQTELPTDSELAYWFNGRSDRNIGVITGEFSGLFVLDVDDEPGWATVLALGVPDTISLMSREGRGQFWFKHPGFKVANAVKFLPGLDLRGDGGYAQCPPSIHKTGSTYTWVISPDDGELADAPEWLLEYARKKTEDLGKNTEPVDVSTLNGHKPEDHEKSYAFSALVGECKKVSEEPDGSKHIRLLKSSVAMGGFIPLGAIDESDVEENLFRAIESRAEDKKAARTTIQNGIKYGKERPRQIPPQKEPIRIVFNSKHAEERKTEAESNEEECTEEDTESDEMPRIEVCNQQLETMTQALAAALEDYNARHSCLFSGAQGMVHIIKDNSNRIVISPCTAEVVQDAAAKAALWVSTNAKGNVSNAIPPKNLCSIFVQTPGNWQGITPLETVVNAPFFAPDGTLCAENGYHYSASVWLDMPDLKLPDTTPTAENLEKALGVINHLLKEVAFANQSSRAHAIALMLLPLVRRMIDDCTPLHLWDAPTQSSGKSYAAELCISPFDNPEPMSEIEEEAEWAKSIFTTFLQGRRFLFFDNIKKSLSSSALASYLTSKSKTDRILGTNKMATVSTLSSVWVATSNNARLDADSRSRTLLIRLDTGMEQPEDRKFDFDPKQYVAENRAKVLGALITVVRNWIDKGKPVYKGDKSRYKEWAKVMGGILEAAGIKGFLENVDEARETLDPETEAWRSFTQEWWNTHGVLPVTSKSLISLTEKESCEGINDIIGSKEGRVSRLGHLLNRHRDQIFGNYKISRKATKTNVGIMWNLVLIETPKKPVSDDDDCKNDANEDYDGE